MITNNPFHNLKLDPEEQAIEDDLNAGAFTSVPNLEAEKKRFQAIATATLNKTKNINIRLPEKTILKLKAKAAESGVPYQTLIASVLHRYAGDKKDLAM
jgi:predicted DNA binding CopG/RHH family protein